jgi:hypothetical protein
MYGNSRPSEVRVRNFPQLRSTPSGEIVAETRSVSLWRHREQATPPLDTTSCNRRSGRLLPYAQPAGNYPR